MQTAVMPKMSDTMEEGKIAAWRKQEGDLVQKGDSLAEVETDKVNIEAEAFDQLFAKYDALARARGE